MSGPDTNEVRHLDEALSWPSVLERARGVHDAVAAIDPASFHRAVQILVTARAAGACVYVAGNGGSAATASHWVNDLQKTTMRYGRGGMRAISLSDNIALLTAFANDDGFDTVFRNHLATHLQPSDVLVVISVSGSSPNLVHAARFAADLGATSVGLLGWDGGALAGIVDAPVLVPSPRGEYPIVECVHLLLCDALCAEVRQADMAVADCVERFNEEPRP